MVKKPPIREVRRSSAGPIGENAKGKGDLVILGKQDRGRTAVGFCDDIEFYAPSVVVNRDEPASVVERTLVLFHVVGAKFTPVSSRVSLQGRRHVFGRHFGLGVCGDENRTNGETRSNGDSNQADSSSK